VASSAELLPGRFSSALELSSSRLPERAKGNVLLEASDQAISKALMRCMV
jgi:hypothetical protein